jgi:hypothetical protein
MLGAMKLFGRRWDVDVELEVGSDGSAGPCYFCGGAVVDGSDFAIMVVERINPKGEPTHAACHGACVERAHRL